MNNIGTATIDDLEADYEHALDLANEMLGNGDDGYITFLVADGKIIIFVGLMKD